jgi:hypothetical protein
LLVTTRLANFIGKGLGFLIRFFGIFNGPNFSYAIAIPYIQYYSVILVVSDKTNKSENYPNEEKFGRAKRQDNYIYF